MSTDKDNIVVEAPPRPASSPLKDVKHVVAIGSGKGGVGKSTTAVNLAVAFAKLGARVGLMDADIYGPSVPKLLGLKEPPTQKPGQKIKAPELHGVKCMSMALLGGDAPVVWRGPMASRAITQFLSEVDWGELDYLFVDLPPGTGDVQITLSQAARLSGAVVVMTPQALASEIAKRGLQMFQQVRVPVLGIVENMSGFECEHCGERSHIFSQGGGEQVAQALHVPLLSSIPLDPKIVRESDEGTPVMISRPDSKAANVYVDLAKNLAVELEKVVTGKREDAPPIVVNMEPNTKAKIMKVMWNDGKQSLITFRQLRFLCPCASCVDEGSGQRTIRLESVDPNVMPQRVESVGNYAVKVSWSDGHSTGIYSYDYLRKVLESGQ